VRHFAILTLIGGLVFSAGAIGAPPYTPSQTTPKVVIETIVGDITIELFPSQAPITVSNFLQYVNSGFYNDLIIHRTVPNFVIQGGGFEPGCIERTEGLRPPIINESYNGLSNLRGTVAMARTTDPNSATSQFYINVVDNSANLDRRPGFAGYCVFGQVISGMGIVDQIQQLPHLPPEYANGQEECPYYGKYWVYVFRQQVRVCVSPTGNDTTGLGSVDSPLKTIQKGIDVVNEPGHVVLAPATYTGTGNRDVNVTVRRLQCGRLSRGTPMS
jgi:cyclophilin family peptidyl-prolyl cis-trans isomerase